MNVYYTAKDIEDLAASGTKELVLSPGVYLTDYARDTARQLEITLVRGEGQNNSAPAQPAPQASSAAARPLASDRFNKPAACQHGAAGANQSRTSQSARPAGQSDNGSNPTTVNKLVDLMGKALKRGG